MNGDPIVVAVEWMTGKEEVLDESWVEEKTLEARW